MNRGIELVDLDTLVLDERLDRYNLAAGTTAHEAVTDFGKADEKLQRSLQQVGMREPLVVKELGDGKWLLIDGFRRIRQIRYLLDHDGVGDAIDVHALPCYVLREGGASEPALRSEVNEARQDLPPGLLARKFKLLNEQFHLSTTKIARMCGFTQPSITHYLAVARSIDPVIDAVDAGRLPITAGRIFWVLTEEGQKELWRLVEAMPREVKVTRERLLALREKVPASMYRVPLKDRMRRARTVIRGKKRMAEERRDTRRWLQEDFEQINGEVEYLKQQLKDARIETEPWARAWAAALKNRAVRDYMRQHESGRLADIEEILLLELGDWRRPKN